MDRWRNKVAIVTGASAGIGLATAKALVSEGLIVIGLARRKEKMIKEMSEVTGPGKFYPQQCDVSKEEDVIKIIEYVKQTFGSLSILINNAGIIKMKRFQDAETKELEEVINCNLLGLMYFSKHAIKLMKETVTQAHIVNINSIAGHKVLHQNWFGNNEVYHNIYPATKFAVTALSETLVNELKGDIIRITSISPGVVKTEIVDESFLVQFPYLQSKDIADAVLYVIGTPHHVQITQLTIKPLGEPF